MHIKISSEALSVAQTIYEDVDNSVEASDISIENEIINNICFNVQEEIENSGSNKDVEVILLKLAV